MERGRRSVGKPTGPQPTDLWGPGPLNRPLQPSLSLFTDVNRQLIDGERCNAYMQRNDWTGPYYYHSLLC